jgi:hypothetical protein
MFDNPKIDVANQSTIANARTNKVYRFLILTGSVTSASCSGSVAVQSYRCSLFFMACCNFLNKTSEIIGPYMKSKANAEIWFVNGRIVYGRRLI